MNHFRRRYRRALAVVSSALIGLLGGIILAASPAAAQTSTVTGSCGWDGTAAEWVVTWTVTTDPPAGATAFRWLAVEATPSPVAGIEATPAGEFPHRAGQQLVGEQRLPEGTTSASLTVQAEWDNGQQDAEPSRGELQLPADCSRGDLISQWRLDCDAVTITIQNPTAEPVTVTLVPNAGNPVPVQVAGGEAATVEFPPSPGLSVDVRVGEQSIVDPGDPITVTAGQVAALECAAEQEGGGGGGLPATGTSALIVAAGALALLALGAGLYLIARRRRIRFTA